MKAFFSEIRQAVVSLLILVTVCCGLYPLAVWGLGRAVFADKADGSLIKDGGGTVRGSALLGQPFTGPGYFHSRPSAAGANGYDAAASGGSNLGPASQKLADAIRERVAAYRTLNNLSAETPVPADAVTVSGSGLDPHISPANAALQAPRVAKNRGLSTEQVTALIQSHTAGRDWGLFGEPGVNVLKLNLALDALRP